MMVEHGIKDAASGGRPFIWKLILASACSLSFFQNILNKFGGKRNASYPNTCRVEKTHSPQQVPRAVRRLADPAYLFTALDDMHFYLWHLAHPEDVIVVKISRFHSAIGELHFLLPTQCSRH